MLSTATDEYIIASSIQDKKYNIIYSPPNQLINVPAIRNGANGISAFIPNRFEKRRGTITSVPVQNASSIASVVMVGPKRNPIPNANFASPKPIHRPPEKNHKEPKKRNPPRPDKKCGSTLESVSPRVLIMGAKKEITING